MKLGSKLMQRTLRWIDQYFPGSSVLLSVNPTLRPAVRTYLGQGFVFTGKEEPLGHDSPAIIREMMRVRT
jgi:predicted GNAT family N-acyltransferase